MEDNKVSFRVIIFRDLAYLQVAMPMTGLKLDFKAISQRDVLIIAVSSSTIIYTSTVAEISRLAL